MTDTTAADIGSHDRSRAPARPRFASQPALRPSLVAIAVCLALMVPVLIALGFDQRTLNGASVWAKPLKFQVSLAIHFATVVVLAGLMSKEALDSRMFRWPLAAGAFAAVVEIFYITLQAARGRASHFNGETPVEATLYNLMGVGAVLIVAASFVTGWLIWRRPSAAAVSKPGLRSGAAVGLILGSLLTLGFGGYLGSLGGHLVGIGTDATGLPVVGWSTTIGDLRVPHFFATHMMQALPLVGLLADRHVVGRARLAVVVAALLGVAIVVATFVQAQAGLPFIAL